ncbi:MAG: ribosome-associated translation inhibitor RaiA [Candidatus Moranbacteria bacterium]|nr:ribosome-associated translation inhibitor RaiA [Candidatus Moranbacteria bacterium]
MNINIKATNIELTSAISDYINKKLEGFDRFKKSNDEELTVFVEVGKTTNHHKQGDYYRAEFNIILGGDKFYTFTEKEDLYKSIDIAKDDILRKIKNKRERRSTLIRRGAGKIKQMIRGLYQRQ